MAPFGAGLSLIVPTAQSAHVTGPPTGGDTSVVAFVLRSGRDCQSWWPCCVRVWDQRHQRRGHCASAGATALRWYRKSQGSVIHVGVGALLSVVCAPACAMILLSTY